MFALNTFVAMVLGACIGWERKLTKHNAAIRTNALAALGAAMFVGISALVADTPLRVSAAVTSGLGFLGAGVIMREGTNVRGLNTAATLWCSGAVGAIAGAGFPWHAAIGASYVLLLHFLLRPKERE